MTIRDIGEGLLGLALPLGTARRFALPGFTLACLLALFALWGGWQMFDWLNDRKAVKNATNEANAEFGETMNEATGEADVASQSRREEFEARRRATQELIDEAVQEGCAVGDYIASRGVDCVRAADPVSPPAAQSS